MWREQGGNPCKEGLPAAPWRVTECPVRYPDTHIRPRQAVERKVGPCVTLYTNSFLGKGHLILLVGGVTHGPTFLSTACPCTTACRSNPKHIWN